MNAKTALKSTSEHGGPIVLAAGAASLLVAFVGLGHDRPVAAAPAPTVTVTGPATTVHAPAPSTPSASSAGAADRRAASAAQPVVIHDAPRRPGSGTTSGPTPRPTSTPAPPGSTSCTVGLTLLAIQECLSLGGSR